MADPEPLALSPSERRRAYSAIFTGVAVSTIGFLASNTVNSLIAEDLTGSASWSGIPAAASVLGTAAGATALAALVRRVGPRMALTLGYVLATLAIATAGYAILARHFVLFVAALFVFGVGYGSNRLARYVAADLYPVAERGTMIGWIVWASTIGAVAGPALLAPSRELAEWMQVNGLIGPYLVCTVATALSGAAMLAAPRRMDVRAPARVNAAAGPAPALSALLREPMVTLALVSMVSGQFVMVLLMTMTPVHIRHEGHGLGAIGLVISAHTLGMFALSPLTGRLADRFGRVPLLKAGVAVLVGACLAGIVAASRSSYPLILVSLLLLGVGWNLGFVGGSALLTDSVSRDDRSRVQGLGDSLIWGGGAIASIASGWMLERTGFAVLSLIGAVLALAPIVPLWAGRKRPAAS
ncbi:MAG: MFS transporter [Vicinamibacterales bacterium]